MYDRNEPESPRTGTKPPATLCGCAQRTLRLGLSRAEDAKKIRGERRAILRQQGPRRLPVSALRSWRTRPGPRRPAIALLRERRARTHIGHVHNRIPLAVKLAHLLRIHLKHQRDAVIALRRLRLH